MSSPPGALTGRKPIVVASHDVMMTTVGAARARQELTMTDCMHVFSGGRG